MDWQIIKGNVPSKSNSYMIIKRGNHASLAKTQRLKDYENSFFMQCAIRDANINSFFEFHIKVFYPSNRSDLDNSLKICLDTLQAVKAIKNDNKCVKIIAEKYIDVDNPRVEFKIIPVNDNS